MRGLLEQTVPIVDVWAHNFDAELQILSQMAKHYPVVAFVLTPTHKGHGIPGQRGHPLLPLQLLRAARTGLPAHLAQCRTHQADTSWVHARRSQRRTSPPQRHMAVPSVIRLTARKFGPRKHTHAQRGRHRFLKIENKWHTPSTIRLGHVCFWYFPINSGLILNKNIKWVVFHGCFDFGYLLRELRREPLPRTAEEFYKSLKIYFPCIYDLKQVLKDEEEFRQGGLAAIS